ncbi:NAD-dependent epimerase/dehydratase family protein, partial [Propionibacterium freudenreichii]|uniref:NAD-dependent epimerase/dehydratase family protein n=1 Tax=Propionibacterium freudenreichii TaxID=1744 RepID=UPI0038526A38
YNKQFSASMISCMPCNLYGVGDNYHHNNSHVLPGLIQRIHKAKGHPSVTVWGTGTPLSEFLYVDDLADACILLMQE